MKVIGTNRIDYPQIRNFAGLSFKNYRIEECDDLYKMLFHVRFRLNKKHKMNQFHSNSFKDFGLNNCSGYHFFNAVSFGKKPWMSTFETFVPRWGGVSKKEIEKGLRLLAGSPCKKIIAISECAARIQKQFVQDSASYLYEDISGKIEVIHPPQQCMTTAPLKYDTNHIFTIVGHEFKVKGGIETLNVFDKILGMYPTVILNIVSRMSDLNGEEKSNCRKIMTKHPNIHYYDGVPNSKVLEILKDSHVAILASHADTYGYFVLEAQACGCPVVSTDIRALSEINSNECGWVINLPKNELGQGMVNGKTAPWGYNSAFAEIIEDKLPRIIAEIIENPSIAETKREKAIERIRTVHNPVTVADKLETLYDSCF